jgi:hypothetical protein
MVRVNKAIGRFRCALGGVFLKNKQEKGGFLVSNGSPTGLLLEVFFESK